MKGIIFTEFLTLVEERFGLGVVDEIITNSNLESKGAYTAVGTYNHTEMYTLVHALHIKTKIPVSDLLKIYGEYLWLSLSKGYKHLIGEIDDLFSFLEKIETYIHVEVKKLYPEAELPHFKTKRISEQIFQMVYESERKLADVAEGLIVGCAKEQNIKIHIERKNIQEDGSIVEFLIHKLPNG